MEQDFGPYSGMFLSNVFTVALLLCEAVGINRQSGMLFEAFDSVNQC